MEDVPTLTEKVRLRLALFITLALLINVVDSTLTRCTADPQRQLILAIASTFDLVGVVLALYYWLLVRVRIRTTASMVVVILLETIRASFLFPGGPRIKAIIAALCELGLIGIVAAHIQQTRRMSRELEADPLAVIREVVGRLLPIPVAINALTAELAILYYAFFSWGAKPHIVAGTQPFTNYKKAGQVDLLGVLPIACALEIIPVHVLLGRWNSAIAWAATILNGYALIWLVGVARSFRLRPTLVAHDYVYLRYGLLFQLHVPRSLIASIRRATPNDAQFALPRRAEPSHCFEFVREVTADRLFGFGKRLTRIALTFDDQLALEQALPPSSPQLSDDAQT